MRPKAELTPTWRVVRISLFVLQAAAVITFVSACGRDGRTGSAGPKVNQAAPAAPIHTPLGNADRTRPYPDVREGHPMAGTGAVDRQAGRSLAQSVEAMKEVKNAHVLVVDNTAFVAVVLESAAAGGSDTGPLTAQGTQNGRYGGAASSQDAPQQLKARITSKIKASNQNIQRVYISASPDFAQRMENVRIDAENGRPVAGLLRELLNTAERLLPTRAGSNNPAPAP